MGKTTIKDTPEFRQMWADGVTFENMGKTFGVTKAGIRFAGKRLGLPPRPGGIGSLRMGTMRCGWSAEDDASLRRMREMNLSYDVCAAQLGRSKSAVGKRLVDLGLVAARKPKALTMGQQLRAAEAAAVVPDTSLAGRLRATKGSYAALAEIAAAEGWTHAQVQARWHRARVEASSQTQPEGV